jgi:hypothetical protein
MTCDVVARCPTCERRAEEARRWVSSSVLWRQTLGAGPLASSLPPRDRTYRRPRCDGKAGEGGRTFVIRWRYE